MNDAEYRARLMDELESDPRYASGAKRFPRTVTADDAIAISEVVSREVDRGCDLRAQTAAKENITIACHRGCSGCCDEMVLVRAPEALRVARWLALPENRAVKDAFLERFAVWRERVGDGPERLAALVETKDQAVYDAAHQAEWRKQIKCAFNDQDGACSIWPVRPHTCRNGHAVDTPDRCSGATPVGGAPATRLAFVPLDQFILRANRMLRATANALGQPRSESLCVQVHALLTKG
jgi:hypothetical protein